MGPIQGRENYIWPATLHLSPRPPKLVYLDLLHWVSLAKANCGHPQGVDYQDVLQACSAAVATGKALFPISDSIYMEIAKIGQYRQRRDLREVIELVSRYSVVTSRVVIAQHEVEALLDKFVGPSPEPINAMSYLDWGVARAFGMVGGFRIKAEATGEDVTEEVRAKHPEGPEAFDRTLADAELGFNRSSLDGPTPGEEEEQLRALGWKPRAGHEVTLRRAAQELEQVARFDENPEWRSRGLRDVIAVREIAIEINEMLWRGLKSRGVELEQAFPEVEETRRAFSRMPSFDVSVSLKTAYHRNPEHHWKPNHIQDIDALSSTVPYCDIVVTDREAASHLNQEGVARRFGTVVLASLEDLAAQL
jgi:hypothetical protein